MADRDVLKKERVYSILKWFALCIVFTGIALRIAEWLHHRALMMDEVNVVRNIFERGFIDLWKPLDYEQFAPPVFLWAIKLSSLLFGFGELSLRIVPILCSCLSLYFFYRWLARSGNLEGAWYALALFAFSSIYIQYANDIKQYASDALVTILLLSFAFRDLSLEKTNKQFFLFWSITGAVAVWISMPSVFILAGIGAGFFVSALRKRQFSKLGSIIAAAGIWLLMFLCYYLILLRHQISSDYLQRFHEQYFLKVTSLRSLFDTQNKLLLKELFIACTGNRLDFFLFLNAGLGIVGLFFLFRKGWDYGVLVFVPVFCLFVASSLQLYTLLPRVCIFMMPLVLFIIAYGLSALIRLLKWFSAPFVIAAFASVYQSQQLQLFHPENRIEIDELNKEVDFARKHGVRYDQIYLHPLYTPNLLYYQEIHPNKERGKVYEQLHLMTEPYPAIRERINGRAAFIYFWMDDFTLQQHRDSIFSFLQPIDSLVRPSYKVLVFER